MVVFVIGGSGSGKSEYAENLAVSLKERALSQFHRAELVYVATMEPLDEESKRRVRRHQRQRAQKQFKTRECYTHLEELAAAEHEVILLECLSNLTANEMFSPEGRNEQAAGVIQEGLRLLAENSRHLVVVGNNVFEDGVEYEAGTAEYIRQTAQLHCFLGAMADLVVEVVCGIPVVWKAAASPLSGEKLLPECV